MQSHKRQNDRCSFPRQTIQYHGNPSHAPTSNNEEAEIELFYEDLQDLLELTSKKDVFFIIGDWNTKIGSQEIPGVTGKFRLEVQNEAVCVYVCVSVCVSCSVMSDSATLWTVAC